MVGLRTGLSVGAGILLLTAAVCLADAVAVPVVTGTDVDTRPALLLRTDGSILMVFTRTTRGGASQLLATEAAGVVEAQQGLWSAPYEVFPGSAFGHWAAEFVRLGEDRLGLFFVSDESREERIHAAYSLDEGRSWDLVGQPLGLNEPAGTQHRSPHGYYREETLFLYYEVEEAGERSVHMNRSASGVPGAAWGFPSEVVPRGLAPRVTAQTGGPVIVSYEDPDTLRLTAAVSTSPPASPWEYPRPILGQGSREGFTIEHWDGRPMVYGVEYDAGSSAWRLVRSDSVDGGGSWSPPEQLDGVINMGAGGPIFGHPRPLIVEPGVLCLGWDRRTDEDPVPRDSDIFFACLLDFACTQGPDFAGPREAVDPAPCQTSGVHIAWDPPLHWGTGSSGRYNVYRKIGDPFFEPGALYLIAAGVLGTSYVDRDVEPGARYYYRVRAENDEVCPFGGGPANGGVTDANDTYVWAIDEDPTVPPAEVQRLWTDRAPLEGRIHLTWTPAVGADGYRIYRADGARGGPPAWELQPYTELTANSGAVEPPAGRLLLFTARAVSPCGVEGP